MTPLPPCDHDECSKTQCANPGSLNPVVRVVATKKCQQCGAWLERIADNAELLEVGRKAVEDTLVEWSDLRLSEFNRGNGLVIRERNGNESSIIRMGTEVVVKIALKAMASHLRSNEKYQR